MPAKNPRINVAREKPVYSLIEKIAKEKGISMSMVTRDLVREALEIHEDVVRRIKTAIVKNHLEAVLYA